MDKQESTLLRQRVAEHTILVEDDERAFSHEYTWTSCCLKMDKRALSFFTQAFFSLITICFCITMLVKSPGDSEKYASLLTLVLGVWLPNPKLASD